MFFRQPCTAAPSRDSTERLELHEVVVGDRPLARALEQPFVPSMGETGGRNRLLYRGGERSRTEMATQMDSRIGEQERDSGGGAFKVPPPLTPERELER